MTKKSPFARAPYSVASYIAVLTLTLASFLGLGWAFHSAGLSGLNADQRTISDYFFALLAGGAGFFFGGVVLNLTGTIGPTVRFGVQAFAGSALFLTALFHPWLVSEGLSSVQHGPEPPGKGIHITSPLMGSIVGPTTVVRGNTAYPGWHHYVVVSGLKAGGDMVQDAKVNVTPSGEISGSATIGNAAVGAGQVYTIRFVASETLLMPGPLVPRRDLIFSNSITVRRSIQAERS